MPDSAIYTTVLLILVTILYLAFTRHIVRFLERHQWVDFKKYPLMGNLLGLFLALSIYLLYMAIRFLSALFID
jgi:hypothetical protein